MKLIMSEQEYNQIINKTIDDAEKRGYERGRADSWADGNVKVIRCKDCKFHEHPEFIKTQYGVCRVPYEGKPCHDKITEDLFFCADGEEKET